MSERCQLMEGGQNGPLGIVLIMRWAVLRIVFGDNDTVVLSTQWTAFWGFMPIMPWLVIMTNSGRTCQ